MHGRMTIETKASEIATLYEIFKKNFWVTSFMFSVQTATALQLMLAM